MVRARHNSSTKQEAEADLEGREPVGLEPDFGLVPSLPEPNDRFVLEVTLGRRYVEPPVHRQHLHAEWVEFDPAWATRCRCDNMEDYKLTHSIKERRVGNFGFSKQVTDR